jgi:hypothetical protein
MAVDLSFLEPYFSALAQVPHLQQAAAQQEQQQQQLAETTRHNQADEAVAGRHAEVAEDAGRRAQQAQDLTQADTIMKNGWTPVGSSQQPGASSQNAPAAAPVDLSNDGGLDPANTAGGAPAAPVPAGSLTAGLGEAPATPRQTVSVGGQQYQAPAAAGTPQWKEEHARQLQQGIDDDAAKYGATLNREGMTVPDEVADTLQIPRGQKIMPEHMKALADLHNIVAPPEKQFKPEAPPSMVTLSPTDSKLMGLPAGTRVPMDEYKARGTVAAEASRAAKGEGGGGEKPATRAQYGQVIKDKQTALADSQKQLDKDLAAANKSFAADDTFDKTGAITKAYQDHKARMQQAQLSYEQRASQLSGNDVGHDPWADNLGTDKANPNPGRGGNGGTGGPKQLTDPAKAAEYLKKAGGDKVAARKLAAADNWVF